jgi:hypothetical protein
VLRFGTVAARSCRTGSAVRLEPRTSCGPRGGGTRRPTCGSFSRDKSMILARASSVRWSRRSIASSGRTGAGLVVAQEIGTVVHQGDRAFSTVPATFARLGPIPAGPVGAVASLETYPMRRPVALLAITLLLPFHQNRTCPAPRADRHAQGQSRRGPRREWRLRVPLLAGHGDGPRGMGHARNEVLPLHRFSDRARAAPRKARPGSGWAGDEDVREFIRIDFQPLPQIAHSKAGAR